MIFATAAAAAAAVWLELLWIKHELHTEGQLYERLRMFVFTFICRSLISLKIDWTANITVLEVVVRLLISWMCVKWDD